MHLFTIYALEPPNTGIRNNVESSFAEAGRDAGHRI